MFSSWQTGVLIVLETLNEILAAGIAITAFSLLLYALTFNLRDRVARSFAIILLCVVIVFATDAIGSTVEGAGQVGFWLRFGWVGLIFLPPAYLHFSDALLATTGKPSRGKRSWLVRATYVFSGLILLSFPFLPWLGELRMDLPPAPHYSPTLLTNFFTIYYAASMTAAWFNFLRAYQRTLTPTSRRRMGYLVVSALAPVLGCFPYLLFSSSIAQNHPIIFWTVAILANLALGGLLVVMAYAVAFFGVSWPDRVVKSRLFKWIMRGPVTASFALAITTLVRRGGAFFGFPYTALVPILMVVTILVLEFIITLLAPVWEAYLFYGTDRADLAPFRNLEERLLTRKDLRQFLEAVVAAVSDRLQASVAFVAGLENSHLEMIVSTGEDTLLQDADTSEELYRVVIGLEGEEMFRWGAFYLMPLSSTNPENGKNLLGILGFRLAPEQQIDTEQYQALSILSGRVAQALQDRALQQQIFLNLQSLQPQVDLIQQIRAAGRYDQSLVLQEDVEKLPEGLATWVRDALNHYWGGPKLTQNPLVNLNVVQAAAREYDGNTANAVRAILRQAVERVRPQGERRFTAEWILYNILEMKFMEGRKVREVALRLAVSEADLYRKQRVAVEAVAKAIIEMEEQSREESKSAV